MKLGWILGVTLLLGACGETDGLPPQIRVQTNFQADPFPNDEAASERAGGYTAISSSGNHTCGIRKDSSLWCWGSNSDGQIGAGSVASVVERPARVLGDVGWERVSAGVSHTCGIRLGSLYCWGNNADGQLGDGSSTGRLSPTLVARGGWKDVSAADRMTCAINAQGKLYCWGYDYDDAITGALPEGANRNIPILVDPTATFRRVIVVSQGTYSFDHVACALEESGSIWCWGLSDSLTASSEGPPNQPRRLGAETDWVGLSFEKDAPCASKADGSRWCWDGASFARAPKEWKFEAVISDKHFCGVALDGSLWCSGQDDFGQLGNGVPRENTSDLVQVGTRTDWVAVATGQAHTCAINQAGEPWCWGSDNLAQLSAGRERTKIGPQLVGSNWDSVSLGKTNTCGIQQGQILCWGGQVHLPLLSPLGGLPVKVDALGEQVGFGYYATCTLTQGKVACWSNTDDKKTAWDLTASIHAIAVGDYATCGIADDGTLYCRSTDSGAAVLYTVGTDLWQSISVNTDHFCGITRANKLFCWDSTYSSSSEPVPQAVTPEREYVEVAVGSGSSCAIATDQSLWCWGGGYFGALGTGSSKNEPLPVRVGTELWSQVSVNQHACAIRADGALFCWGPNGNGQLGIPVSQGTKAPLQVGSATDWKHVEAGPANTCAINQANQLYCWGNDSDGQIGVQEPWLAAPARVWPR